MRNWRSILIVVCILVPRTVCADITTGLVGRWALDETALTTAADSSGLGNNGTLINGPAWNPGGKIAGALSFDGLNDYVSLGNPASLIPGSAITLAAWFNLSDVTYNRFILSKYDGVAPQNDTFLRFQAGTGVACAVGGSTLIGAATITAGQWYHVVCTYDGASIRLYLNGTQMASVGKSGAIADEAGTAWLIGARTPANPTACIAGLLDDVRIYNRALTGPDVAQLFAFPAADITTGLSGLWPLDETSGPTAFDVSGNANNGTLANGPAWNSAGRVGGALAFDGINDYVTLGNPASLIPGSAITVAGWFKLTDVTYNRFILSKYDGLAPQTDTFLRYQAGTGLACSVGGTYAVGSATIVAGQWYHGACTYDGSSVRVYLDGTQIGAIAKSGSIADEAGTAWLIGARTPANPTAFIAGLLDDVRIYSRALTAADLAFLISLGGALDSTPPVLTNGAPTGALPSGTTQTTMSLTTDENAVCRYSSTPNTSYASMTGTFTNTGATAHSTTLTGLVDGNAYTRYVRCRDGALNANGADYPIAFSVSVNRFLTVSSWAAFVPAANGVGTLPKGYKGGVFDGRYAYFVPNFKGNSEVMRFDTTAPFSAASSWATYDPNPPSGGGYVGGAFDGRYVYFAPYHNGTQSIGEVLRYDTQSPFTTQASWSTFDPSANGVGVSPKGYWGAFFDGRYVYFSPEWQSTIKEHGEVLRYDTTLPFTQAASWRTYDAGAHGVGTDPDGYKGIGSDGTYLYFVPYYNGTASHGEVLRYDRRGAFDVVSSWATYTPAANGVGNIAKGFEDAVFDGRYLYFVPSYSGTGSNAYHGEVLRYDTLAPFQTASSWAAFDPGSNGVGLDPDGYNGGTFDGRFIYFAPTNNGTGPHGEVLMYDTTKPFNSAGSWLTYDPGAHGIGTDPDGFAGTIFDQRYVYFVPDRNETGVPSGEVLRYDTGTTLQTTTVAALTVHDTSRASTLPLVNAGSLVAIVGDSVNTLVTLTNPTNGFVEVLFDLTDSGGRQVGAGGFVLAPSETVAATVDTAPFHAGGTFAGSVVFRSSQPITAAVMRTVTTDLGERLVVPVPLSVKR